jgi:hypothetical protein
MTAPYVTGAAGAGLLSRGPTVEHACMLLLQQALHALSACRDAVPPLCKAALQCSRKYLPGRDTSVHLWLAISRCASRALTTTVWHMQTAHAEDANIVLAKCTPLRTLRWLLIATWL